MLMQAEPADRGAAARGLLIAPVAGIYRGDKFPSGLAETGRFENGDN